ncbi:MAG: demethylmenaquinone methyltransferase [Angustibacter sp.]
MSRAQLDKRPADIAHMFDLVAARYDITNTILSAGQDRHWRALVRRSLDLRPGERVLDAAAGTGSSAAPLVAVGAQVVAADFSLGMLRAGRERGGGLPMCAADATRLPFADGVFDAVTMSFGLRNVSQPDRALAELFRVTKPGGRILICEFSQPPSPPLRRAYLGYLMRALPAVARRVSSNPESYEYLAESIRAWPDQAALAGQLTAAGWRRVGWRNATGGIVALHRGYRPGPSVIPGSLPGAAAAGVDSASVPVNNHPDGRQTA